MPTACSTEPSRWGRWLAPTLLVVVIIVVFGRTCLFDFTLWDDPQTVSRNPLLNPPSLPNVLSLWKTPIENLYIPVTYTVWSVAAWIGWLDVPDPQGIQLNPSVFHCLNLTLHLSCAMLVLALLLRVTRDRWAAFVGAALFALHPVQVEALAWVSGTKDLLYALLSLLVAATFLQFVAAEGVRPRWGWYCLGTFLVAAAILAKPTGVVAPVLAVGFVTLERRKWRRSDLAAAGSWLVIAAAGGIIARLVQTGENAGEPAPLWFRPFVALDALSFYMGKLVWPFRLAIDYGRSPHELLRSGAWRITPLLPLAVLGLLIGFRIRRRVWVALFLSLLPLLPVLGILTFAFQFYSTVADHYLYLTMFGVSLLSAAAVSGLTQKAVQPTRVMAVRVTVIAVLIGMGTLSFFTAANWQTSRTLFEHTIEVNPRSFIAHYDLAVLDERENQPARAIGHYRQAIAIRPDYVPAHTELGSLLMRSGQSDGGLEEWTKAIELTQQQEPGANLAGAYVNVIRACLQLGRTKRAADLLGQAVERYPNDKALIELRTRLLPATRPPP